MNNVLRSGFDDAHKSAHKGDGTGTHAAKPAWDADGRSCVTELASNRRALIDETAPGAHPYLVIIIGPLNRALNITRCIVAEIS